MNIREYIYECLAMRWQYARAIIEAVKSCKGGVYLFCVVIMTKPP